MSNHDGHRVYDGCPDSTMQRRLDAEAKESKRLTEEIRKRGLDVTVTYFPVEERYCAFDGSHLTASGMCTTKIDALRDVLRRLEAL